MSEGILQHLSEGYRGRVARRDNTIRDESRRAIVRREEVEARRLLARSEQEFSEGNYEEARDTAYEGFVRQIAAAQFDIESRFKL